MMTYEIFKEVVTEKFMEFSPKQYEEMSLVSRSVEKVNKTVDGLTLEGEGVRFSPTIYINDLYEKYKENENLSLVLTEAASLMDQAMREGVDIIPSIQMENAKDNIVFQLVNTEQNKGLLENVPNRAFQDLSILYRWVVKVEEDGIQSTVVNNTLAKQLGMREEELFSLAVENTKRIFPPNVRNMNEVMREMFLRDGMPEDMLEMMFAETSPEQSMYVISNEQGIHGAISMLYEDKLHTLAESLETDLYIMPSSVHEVIAVSSNMGDPNELAEMVAEINMEQVSLEERLSNQVYHYDKDLRKLTLATDTPNKRIDGIVAEPNLIYQTAEKSR